MQRPTNIFVYLGTGDEGQKLEDLIKKEAKRRGFAKKGGDANVSPFIVHCIKYTVAHEKK